MGVLETASMSAQARIDLTLKLDVSNHNTNHKTVPNRPSRRQTKFFMSPTFPHKILANTPAFHPLDSRSTACSRSRSDSSKPEMPKGITAESSKVFLLTIKPQ